MSQQQPPSIGRIVHYTNLGDADGKYPPSTQAALITAVHEAPAGTPVESAPSGLIVDLHIFYRTGQFDMQAVPFSETPKRGHWNWPPRV